MSSSVTFTEALPLVRVALRSCQYPPGVLQSVFEFWYERVADEDGLVPADSLDAFVTSCRALQQPEAGTVAFDPSLSISGGLKFMQRRDVHTFIHTNIEAQFNSARNRANAA